MLKANISIFHFFLENSFYHLTGPGILLRGSVPGSTLHICESGILKQLFNTGQQQHIKKQMDG